MAIAHNKLLALGFLTSMVFLINYCQHEAPLQMKTTPCIDNQPVEDTTRVYFWPESRDTLRIYPKMIFARFHPWVTEKDTNQIKQLAAKHNLRLWGPPYGLDQQLADKCQDIVDKISATTS